jgi:hypothetical protein
VRRRQRNFDMTRDAVRIERQFGAGVQRKL